MFASESTSKNQSVTDYQLVEKALIYIEERALNQPNLEEVAAHIGLSEYHFQRLFTRWVGISPKRFLQVLTREYAKNLLDQSASVMETAYLTGLSSPGRLHDLFVTLDAVTPGEYKQHGAGLEIYYGFHPSPFGDCMVAMTERGLCGMAFVCSDDRENTLLDFQRRWKLAKFVCNQNLTETIVDKVFFQKDIVSKPLSLHLNGTNFQIKVWEALLHTAPGVLTTYNQIASEIGKPKASRAVGQAVGANPISYIIPCHRVIRQHGVLGGYRWGTARKQAILGWELSGARSLYAHLITS